MLISTQNTIFRLRRFCFQQIRYTLLRHFLPNETTYQDILFPYCLACSIEHPYRCFC